ncbi:3-oxo-5-alpha-steroid 4-dehydrogenase [Coemansia reversa NRRL 1564]|uniref:3-oxo-5-alpha-steroid 4-dehydrogenase n=1 Tax=Coemansia reversa (strain ATCC 12441 / NRRL 1564) TaxID=763665 RepID=A0A2G5BGJ9_COERN|nr:3-oxo-5-alpha-steroid 4-dehydrogenase [Coemansia reversa NRRL 1564]|eukprot:PIA18158.1 3-oxo-5-alpha-steroid 4-dehydrogenase [Coemansia reversa NRRL 1564]
MIPEKDLFDNVLRGFWAVSWVIAGALMVVGSPYGSQTSYRGKLAVNGQLAWIVMELVSPVALLYARFSHMVPVLRLFKVTAATHSTGPAAEGLLSFRNLLVLLWLMHYAYRAILYPLRQPSRKPMHLGIMLSAVVFNSINGYLNGRWLSMFAPLEYQQNCTVYIADNYGRCWVGLILFVGGIIGNIYHDNILMRLRRSPQSVNKKQKPISTRYSIPYGGLFSFVSCPHYLCELIEWVGFAILSDSPAAWTFVINVACNLIPRAYHIHNWYLSTFPTTYPPSRKAVIPYLL